MDMTVSGKLSINADKKTLDSIRCAFDPECDVEDFYEVEQSFEGVQGEYLGEELTFYIGNTLIIPFEQSYDITDVDDTVDMIRILIECFPEIESVEFIGTSNCWSSGEHGSFIVEYRGNNTIMTDESKTTETDDVEEDEIDNLEFIYGENESRPFELMPLSGEKEIINLND